MGLLLRKATSNVEHSGSKRGKLDAVDLPHYRCHLQRGTAALSRPLRVRVPGIPGGSASEEDLIEHARESIAGYKVPKSIEFREEPLPLSGAMKVLKRELRAPYWEGKDRQI